MAQTFEGIPSRSVSNYNLRRFCLTTLFNLGFSLRTRQVLREINLGSQAEFSFEDGLEKLNSRTRGLKEKLSLVDAIDKAENELDRLEKLGWSLVSIFDATYPERLKLISDPPVLLYYKGRIPFFSSLGSRSSVDRLRDDPRCGRPAVGIVGTRKAKAFGKLVSGNLAYNLTRSGIITVSGLAKGIDGAAHLGAIKAVKDGAGEVGAGVAVLGAGLNVSYPREHFDLAESMVDNGGAVITEYCLDTQPHKFNFPERNRIISGLSDGVCVVEAAVRSGSIITANLAADQGRDVMAFPGRVGDSLSDGTNSLIRNGATLVLGSEDVMEAIGRTAVWATSGNTIDSLNGELSHDSSKLIEVLQEQSDQSFDELLESVGGTPQSISTSILKLKKLGAICEMPGELYRLVIKA